MFSIPEPRQLRSQCHEWRHSWYHENSWFWEISTYQPESLGMVDIEVLLGVFIDWSELCDVVPEFVLAHQVLLLRMAMGDTAQQKLKEEETPPLSLQAFPDLFFHTNAEGFLPKFWLRSHDFHHSNGTFQRHYIYATYADQPCNGSTRLNTEMIFAV